MPNRLLVSMPPIAKLKS